jgi:hypothetical protein
LSKNELLEFKRKNKTRRRKKPDISPINVIWGTLFVPRKEKKAGQISLVHGCFQIFNWFIFFSLVEGRRIFACLFEKLDDVKAYADSYKHVCSDYLSCVLLLLVGEETKTAIDEERTCCLTVTRHHHLQRDLR